MESNSLKIIQNFSSRKHVAELPMFDILIWVAGLIQFKNLGYKLKLYCEKKDYDFLEKWGLLKYYDEVDDTYLSSLETDDRFKAIDGTKFWSVRKLFCINHEWQQLKKPFIYFDTDVVLMQQLPDITDDLDLLAWCIEKSVIYLDFDCLSAPANYALPYYQLYNYNAYNCGILYFKDNEKFDLYFNEYLKFTMNNPCEMHDYPINDIMERNIWACNAEQRLLRGIACGLDWHAAVCVESTELENCDVNNGNVHYYILRGLLHDLDVYPNPVKRKILELYNKQIKSLLAIVESVDAEVYEKFLVEQNILDLVVKDIPVCEYI